MEQVCVGALSPLYDARNRARSGLDESTLQLEPSFNCYQTAVNALIQGLDLRMQLRTDSVDVI